MKRPPDLRLEMRLKNNILWKAIHEKHKSTAAFLRWAEENGVVIGQQEVSNLVCLRLAPRMKKTGEYRRAAQHLADLLKMLPEDLFPDHIYAKVQEPVRVLEAYSLDAIPGIGKRLELELQDEDVDFDAGLTAEEVRAGLSKVLDTIGGQRRRVLELLYGLGDNTPHTLEEVGAILGVKRERVHQIRGSAIRRLQHPVRMRMLGSLAPERIQEDLDRYFPEKEKGC